MNKSRIRILSINLIILIAVIGVGFWGYSSLHPKATAAALQTVTVQRGDVSSTVSASGTVISPSDIGLAPTVAGTLQALYVKVGDTVHAGETLAQMDTSALKSALAQAQQSLVTAKNSLATSSLQLQNDQQAVKTAQENLAYQATLITASQATDAQAVNSAQTTITNDQATAVQNLAVYQSTVDSAKSALDGANLNYNNYEGLYGPSGITISFCQNINTINSNCTQLVSYYNAVVSAQSAYNNALISQKQKISADALIQYNDQQALLNAQATQALNVKKNQQTMATAQQAVAAAQYTLQVYETQNGMASATDSNSVAAAQIAVAQAAYDQAQKNLAGATVVAPVSGKVASISNIVGGNVGTATTPPNGATNATGFIVLTDVGALQVTAGFSESDVAKLSTGQQASVSFAALPNVSAPATVSNIALLPTTASGATSYTVTFQLASAVPGLKPGMTATVTVTVGNSLNVISVTSRAVTTRGSGSTVNLVTTVAGKQVETRTRVVLGLIGDSSDEVLSGLKVGQTVALPTIGGTVGSNGFPSITGVPGALGGAGLGAAVGGGGRGGGGGGFGG